MRTRDEELKNHDKMTKNLFFEYEKLQKRLEKVSDPSYQSNLRRRSNELDQRIKTLNKD